MIPLARRLSDRLSRLSRKASAMRFAAVSSLCSLALAALLLCGPAPAAQAAPDTAPAGVTALSGQVMSNDGHPLANVALRDGIAGTRTDGEGRFLLQKLPAGASVLTIDGHHAGADGQSDYGLFEVRVEAVAGRTTALGFTSYLPKIDHEHEVAIDYPTTSDVVVKCATIDGLELHVPKGAYVTGPDGQPVKKLSITAIPVDRPPYPLPPNVEVPVYFTAQDGGATITGVDGQWLGAQVYYPNYHHELPKARLAFWRYDPFQDGWAIYGQGKVSADGRQVIPDPGTRIYDLTGAMISSGALTPACGCGKGNGGNVPAEAGEPVDLASGHWVETTTDLTLNDVLPLTLSRTYQSGDFNMHDFGVGTSLPYDIYLYSGDGNQNLYLVLPSGTSIHYTLVPGGPSTPTFGTSVWVNTEDGPSPFYQSHITATTSADSTLTLQDGTQFFFGPHTPLTGIQDRFGNKITITRAPYAYSPIAQVASPNGRFINFTRDSNGSITEAQDNAGRTVRYAYDSSERLQTVTDADGGVTTYGWDAGNHIATITDARGNVTVTNTYDSDDRVLTQTAADSGVYRFAYTGGGNDTFNTEADVTDPNGSVRKVTFNSFGFVLTDKFATGTSIEEDFSYSRDSASNLILSSTDALGRITSLTYDGIGDVTSVTQLAGTSAQAVTQATYGAFRQIASITDPLGHVTQVGFDTLNTPVSVTDPLGHVTSFSYDERPLVATITDPLGNTTSLAYDTGLLATVTDPLGRVSTAYTDPAGRVIRAADPLGNTFIASNDPLYGAHQITQPKGETTTINYLPTGLIGSVVDARAGTTSYQYDTKARVTVRTDPLGHTDRVTSYDGNDNVLTRIDRKGQTATYAYDALNRLISGSYADGSSVSYGYDAGDRLTQIQDSLAGTITRSYDGFDRLVSETTPQGTVSYTYDAAGRRTSMSVPNQAQVSYSYDVADQLIQVAQGAATVGIAYDADGRRTGLTLPNGIVASYSYDAASQLTGISYAPPSGPALGSLLYSYDFGGNATSRSGALFQSVLPAAVTSSSYDAANRLNQWTTSGATANPTYDANGNLLNDGTQSYTWDARDRLTGITGVASFSYDGAGRRQSATIGGNTVSPLYDGFDTVQEQGTALADMLTGLGVDERYVRTEGTTSSTYLTDALGSTAALTDGTGAIKTSYGYDPYGNTGATGTANDNGFQYAGRQNDGTGLYYNRARYYKPAWGRFIAEDPIGLAGGINRYVYAGGNPLQFTDPFGFQQSYPYPGTTSCHFYDALCNGPHPNPYYCLAAPFVCGHSPNTPVFNCVRQCLQDRDASCHPPCLPGGGPSTDPICVVNIHGSCWNQCLVAGMSNSSLTPSNGPPPELGGPGLHAPQ
jgi:RHS repeat-associated protein